MNEPRKLNQYEYNLICILIANSKVFDECGLEAKHFDTPFYRSIYPDMKKQYLEKGFIDFVEMEGKYAGFMEFALDCVNKYVTSAHAQYYIEKIEEQYKMRECIKVLRDCESMAIEYDEMKARMKAIDEEFIKKGTVNKLGDDEILDLITRTDETLEFSVFVNTSKRFKFIKKGIHVISARPGIGKSALAINLMNDLSRRYKCIYLNMEMSEQKIYQRMISCESNIPVDDFRTVKNDSRKLSFVKNAIRNVNRRKYEVRNGSKSLKAIKTIITKESKEEHLILFIDYVGYVTTGKSQSDKDRIGEVTRELQLMTKDFDCTIFLLSQLNREGNDEPKLVNLKDSGELEQSAETVLFLHNPSKDINDQEPLYDVIIAKNRNWQLGKIKMRFNKPCQKFEEVIYDEGVRGYHA